MKNFCNRVAFIDSYLMHSGKMLAQNFAVFKAAGIMQYLIRCNTPNEKYIVSFVLQKLSPLLAKLAVCKRDAKSQKNDSRHLRQLLGRRSVNKRNNNFSGSDTRIRYGIIPTALPQMMKHIFLTPWA